MKSIFTCFFLILLIVFHSTQAFAKDFDAFMLEWNENRELASQYLLAAEKALKEGDKNLGCANQQKASKYGVEATRSLIRAMKSIGSTDGIENFEAGLNKWKELGDFC